MQPSEETVLPLDGLKGRLLGRHPETMATRMIVFILVGNVMNSQGRIQHLGIMIMYYRVVVAVHEENRRATVWNMVF